MPWYSKWFSKWPKRCPEGFVKYIDIPNLRIVLCGANHPELEGHDKPRLGGSFTAGAIMWLRIFQNTDGTYTLKGDAKALEIVGYELQNQIGNLWAEMIDPDKEL